MKEESYFFSSRAQTRKNHKILTDINTLTLGLKDVLVLSRVQMNTKQGMHLPTPTHTHTQYTDMHTTAACLDTKTDEQL